MVELLEDSQSQEPVIVVGDSQSQDRMEYERGEEEPELQEGVFESEPCGL